MTFHDKVKHWLISRRRLSASAHIQQHLPVLRKLLLAVPFVLSNQTTKQQCCVQHHSAQALCPVQQSSSNAGDAMIIRSRNMRHGDVDVSHRYGVDLCDAEWCAQQSAGVSSRRKRCLVATRRWVGVHAGCVLRTGALLLLLYACIQCVSCHHKSAALLFTACCNGTASPTQLRASERSGTTHHMCNGQDTAAS